VVREKGGILWSEIERVLLADVDAVDATALAHDGRFYLFVNLAVPGASLARRALPVPRGLAGGHAPSASPEPSRVGCSVRASRRQRLRA
jgi:hypothetical protein